MHYAYVGNLPGHEYENTYCHGCGKPVVRRYGFYVQDVQLREGKCVHCGMAIPGVWEDPPEAATHSASPDQA